MSEVADLSAAWVVSPPAHIATAQLRDVVITGLGGKPQSAMVRDATAEEFAAAVGLKLPAKAPDGR